MGEVSIIGLDLAKNVFQAHGARADGSVAFRAGRGGVVGGCKWSIGGYGQTVNETGSGKPASIAAPRALLSRAPNNEHWRRLP